MDRRSAMIGAAAALVAGSRRPAAAQGQVEVSFAFPVAVGGPIMRIIDTFVAAFGKDHPSIKVTQVYAGNHQEALASVVAAHRRGTPPTLSALLSTDMFSLIDEEVIIPFDTLVDGSDDQAWLNGFSPAFMLNLAHLRDNARFPFGVAVLPANRRRGAPTGGGNFYHSRKSRPVEQEAAATFVRWITQPERAARWSIATGYVAVSPAAYGMGSMIEHLKQFPEAAVARDQLASAV